jgi:hypothetical protein
MASTKYSKVLYAVVISLSLGMTVRSGAKRVENDSVQDLVNQAVKSFKQINNNPDRVVITFERASGTTQSKTKVYSDNYHAPSAIVAKNQCDQSLPANVSKIVVTQRGDNPTKCCVTVYDTNNDRVSSQSISCA